MRRGFTLIELLIYSAIFAIISITLLYFLTLFFRASNNQISSSEIASQANFILQKIQQEIMNASFLVVNDDGNKETDGTLSQPHAKLIIVDRAATSNPATVANDPNSPIAIYQNSSVGTAVVKRGNQTEFILNNNTVKVTNLKFTKISTPPGKDIVLIDLTLQYQSPNPREQISRQFLLGVGKAEAAVFDSDLNPNSSNAKNIGADNSKWKSLFLSGDLNIDGKVIWTTNGTNATNNNISFMSQGMLSIDPPDIGANAQWTTTKTINGIQTGDKVFITAPSDIESGLLFVGARVTATDTLSITIRNVTGSTITNGSTASRNWSYFIIR